MDEKNIYFEKVQKSKWYYPAAALVSGRKRQKIALAELPTAKRVVARDIAVLHEPKIALVKNSKAGCTSFAQLMYYSMTGEFYNGRIHKEARILSQGIARAASNISFIDKQRPFLFTSVRHPVARIASSFRNIVLDETNPVAEFHHKPLAGFGLNKSKSDSYNFDVFLDYVEESLRRDRLLSDRHWREQVVNVVFESFEYDLIIKLESQKEHLDVLFEVLEIPRDVRDHLSVSRFNKSSPRKTNLEKHQIARIESIYHADFEAFSY